MAQQHIKGSPSLQKDTPHIVRKSRRLISPWFFRLELRRRGRPAQDLLGRRHGSRHIGRKAHPLHGCAGQGADLSSLRWSVWGIVWKRLLHVWLGDLTGSTFDVLWLQVLGLRRRHTSSSFQKRQTSTARSFPLLCFEQHPKPIPLGHFSICTRFLPVIGTIVEPL